MEDEKTRLEFVGKASKEFSADGFEQFRNLVGEDLNMATAEEAYIFLINLAQNRNQWILTEGERVDDIGLGAPRGVSEEFLEWQQDRQRDEDGGAAADWEAGERRGGRTPSP